MQNRKIQEELLARHCALEVNKPRKKLLDQFLPQLFRSHDLRIALDADQKTWLLYE